MSKVILNIGQQPDILKVRGLVLAHAGFRVINVTDKQRALEAAETDSFDLVLFCHTLPPRTLGDILARFDELAASTLFAYVRRSDYDQPPYKLLGVPGDAPDLIAAVQDMLNPPLLEPAPSVA